MPQKAKVKRQESSEMDYGTDTCGCPVESLNDRIRSRAYQLFEMRGRQPGQELDDWLQAEREEEARLGL